MQNNSYTQFHFISRVFLFMLYWEYEREIETNRKKSRGRDGERELDHYSNVINDSLICMCRTINHSQVNVTDRRLSFPAANRMNFDNINSIPLFPALIHFALFLPWPQDALVIKLSPKFAQPYIEAETGKKSGGGA